jgi:uncharacterized phiE125 gp8 family phage protein
MDSILVTTTAASSRALVTLAEVRDALGITDTSSDTALTRYINRASAAVENHCGRIFARQTYTQTVRTDRARPSILLEQHPIVSITSVVEDDTTLETDEREFDAATGALYRLDGDDVRTDWTDNGKVVIVYVAGYLVPTQSGAGDDLPADITEAVIEVVKDRYFGNGRDPRLRSETHEGVGSASYLDPRDGDGPLPARAADLLWPYVKVTV